MIIVILFLIGQTQLVFWNQTKSCDVMWRQVTSCHIMTRHVTSCHVMSCHVTSHHRVSTLICLGPCWLRKEGDTVQAQFSVLHPCVMWYWNISLSMIISMAKIIDIDIGWTYQSKKTFSFQNLSYNSDLFIRIKLYTLNWHYLSVNCCMRIQQIVHYIQVCSNQCHWSTPFYQRCVAIGPNIWNCSLVSLDNAYVIYMTSDWCWNDTFTSVNAIKLKQSIYACYF